MAASDTQLEDDEAPARRSRLPLLLGLFLAVVTGAATFYSVYSGLLPIGSTPEEPAETTAVPEDPVPDAGAFVPIDPIVVSLSAQGRERHLRFRAELEVATGTEADVARLMPRLLDVLNGYLRAVPLEELETPSALVALRAQLLRRMQLVVGDGKVRDLLITEFVLN